MASTFGQIGSGAGTVPRIGRKAPRDEAGAHFLILEHRNATLSPMTEKANKAKPKNLTKPYEATPSERAAAEACFARKEKSRPSPRRKVSMKGDVATISPDHPEPEIGQSLLMEALGTVDPYFLDGLPGQLANVGMQGRAVEERGLNFMLAVVNGIEPKDQVEAMLAAQMAAIHNATMTFARQLAHVETIPQQDSAERAFNKLARTFVSQVEALKRYRNGGEQTVRVEHVTVNEGGQAIVGDVNHTGKGGGSERKSRNLADARGIAPMRSQDPERESLRKQS
jgi:hypothetical protein